MNKQAGHFRPALVSFLRDKERPANGKGFARGRSAPGINAGRECPVYSNEEDQSDAHAYR